MRSVPFCISVALSYCVLWTCSTLFSTLFHAVSHFSPQQMKSCTVLVLCKFIVTTCVFVLLQILLVFASLY